MQTKLYFTTTYSVKYDVETWKKDTAVPKKGPEYFRKCDTCSELNNVRQKFASKIQRKILYGFGNLHKIVKSCAVKSKYRT